ncbi:3515_t:CDS:2 [Cetraspora pellucida]|uniref:3515_t:CDS:1 n=1 Tax=Cetraspora pellucida TaxID=1433469 RepID=A0A9N8VIP8_9GLOM|nr:3515_t:CDS:2 [Cetraspora pellucida]
MPSLGTYGPGWTMRYWQQIYKQCAYRQQMYRQQQQTDIQK